MADMVDPDRRRLLAAAPPMLSLLAVPPAPDGDGPILAGLTRWLDAMHAAQTLADTDEDAFLDALAVAGELVDTIAALPAAGTAGVVVKAYLLMLELHGGRHGRPWLLDLPDPASPSHDGERLDGLSRSLAADGRRLVPALAVWG